MLDGCEQGGPMLDGCEQGGPMLLERIQDVYLSHYIVFSAKHWMLFMIIKCIHLQLPQGIMLGSLHLDSSHLEQTLDISTLMFLHVHVD